MKNKKCISIILLVIWCIVIFIMSSFNSNDSASQSNIIVSLINKVLNLDNVSVLSLIVRKTGHFLEYLILGILSINCFKNYSSKYLIISIVFCIIYACSDEIHQLFISGRSCQITDMLIDSIGAFVGIFIYKLKNKEVSHEK